MYTKTVFADALDFFKIVSEDSQTLLTLVAKFNFKFRITGLSDYGKLCPWYL